MVCGGPSYQAELKHDWVQQQLLLLPLPVGTEFGVEAMVKYCWCCAVLFYPDNGCGSYGGSLWVQPAGSYDLCLAGEERGVAMPVKGLLLGLQPWFI